MRPFVLLSLVAGAPFVTFMAKLAKTNAEDERYISSLALLQVLVTIPYLTLFLPLELRWLDTGIHLHAWRVLWPMLAFLLLPIAIGMALARYSELTDEMVKWLAPVSLFALLLHVSLYLGAFWTTLENEFGTWGFLYSIGFAIVGWLVGYYMCHPALAKSNDRGPRLSVAISTAQKGSQALLLALLFALGAYYVTAVAALASSIITIVLLVVGSAELGKRVKHQVPAQMAV